MIDPELLEQYGAQKVQYPKNELIFSAGSVPRYYYQLLSGEVKVNNYTKEGKEFIQGIFSGNRSFGEAPILGEFDYPANAVALVDSTLLRLPKEHFLQLLQEHPAVSMDLNRILAKRLQYKSLMAAEISSHEAEHRILTLIDYLKNTIYQIPGQFTYEVELTRQQIADLTGLRVETVIRSMKTIEEKGEIKRINRKVWR